MAAAALLLGWLAAHTDVLFADGLRYIAQARAYAHGRGTALRNAVDHPVYPLAVAAAHRVLGGDRPEDWQTAAQLVSIVAGVLLVIPVYLISRELFGDACAACRLRVALSRAADGARLRRHAEREHVLAVLGVGVVGGACGS